MDNVVYNIQKALGNKFFPQMEEHNFSRSSLGDWLASLYYRDPIKSPIPEKNIVAQDNGMFGGLRELMGAKAPKRQVLAAQSSAPTPTPTPVIPQNRRELADRIKKGLMKYDSTMPVATMSSQLAEAGEGLPDPLLPAIMSLVETHGGRDITRGQNNIYNMLPTRAGISYPDLQRAILGGNGQKGFRGVVTGGLYNDYLESGNLHDFFDTYSPASENASLSDQEKRYRSILEQYFQ